jgi:gliding motility-associated-like protein
VLTNQYGCDSTIYATTTLRPPSLCGIEANMGGSEIPCLENTGTLTITVTLGEAPFNYTISAAGGVAVASGIVTAINTPEVVDGLAAGNYTLTITASTGFSTTSNATIVQLMSPNATATAVAAFNGYPISCTDQSDGTAVAVATGGEQPYTFAWSTTETGTQITDLPAGTYTVTVTDANGCTDVANVTLNEPELLQITFAITELDCFGTDDGVIYVQPSGGVPPYEYTLNGGTPQTSNTFTGLEAGAYTVLTTDANDCEVTEIIVITAPIPLDVELGDNQTISLGESTVIEAVVNYPFDSLASIVWTPMPDTNSECPQCLILETTPLITTTYSVSIVANNGCRDEDKVTVIVDRRRFVYVPNVFSPDKDGDNDWFSVFAKEGTVRNIKSLEVFDRWGNAMYTITDFQPNDPLLGWNGTFRGDDMNPGVYVWYMEVEFIDGVVELYKGDVTLGR